MNLHTIVALHRDQVYSTGGGVKRRHRQQCPSGRTSSGWRKHNRHSASATQVSSLVSVSVFDLTAHSMSPSMPELWIRHGREKGKVSGRGRWEGSYIIGLRAVDAATAALISQSIKRFSVVP